MSLVVTLPLAISSSSPSLSHGIEVSVHDRELLFQRVRVCACCWPLAGKIWWFDLATFERLLVTEDGVIDVLHCPTGAATSEKVCTYDRCGQCFGELELFYGKPGVWKHDLDATIKYFYLQHGEVAMCCNRIFLQFGIGLKTVCQKSTAAGHGSGRKHLASDLTSIPYSYSFGKDDAL